MHRNNFDLEQMMNSGQVFRFNREDNKYIIISNNRKLVLPADNDDFLLDGYWSEYFDIKTNYNNYIESIPESDVYLTNAAKFGSGIRILKQDKWEMLISYIISQQNNIPRIKSTIEKLCNGCGKDMGTYSAFPTPSEILEFDINNLEGIGLGYRAKYIYSAAVNVMNGNIDLDAWTNLSDEELYKELVNIQGVGPKVANCVMLFGYHRINAFPIDVWIKRIIDREYNGHFDTTPYDGFAGVIQQYMFYYERNKDK